MIYLDESREQEAIEAGWIAYRERVPGYESEYRSACGNYRVVAICSDSQVIGALFVRADGVIHMGIVPEWRSRWASRRIIRQMLAYGNKTTLMDDEDPSFISRIGFVKNGNIYEHDW